MSSPRIPKVKDVTRKEIIRQCIECRCEVKGESRLCQRCKGKQKFKYI